MGSSVRYVCHDETAPRITKESAAETTGSEALMICVNETAPAAAENGGGFDHNYVLRSATADDGLLAAARVYDPCSGRSMTVRTDQKGALSECILCGVYILHISTWHHCNSFHVAPLHLSTGAPRAHVSFLNSRRAVLQREFPVRRGRARSGPHVPAPRRAVPRLR